MISLTQCCRAFTLALARLSCYDDVITCPLYSTLYGIYKVAALLQWSLATFVFLYFRVHEAVQSRIILTFENLYLLYFVQEVTKFRRQYTW